MLGQQENDCLGVVRKLYRPIDEALNAMVEFGGDAKLTGTGACVFAAFEDYSMAKSVADALAGKWKVYLTQGLNVSPLQQKLNNLCQKIS